MREDGGLVGGGAVKIAHRGQVLARVGGAMGIIALQPS